MNSCAACAFQYDDQALIDVPERLRLLAGEIGDRLTPAKDGALRRRPAEGVWSPLEYGCHVRDVLLVQRERILLALTEDTPAFASMERDERVQREHYNEQSPTVVAGQLSAAAAALATTLAALGDDEWRRSGVYRWPTTEIRTIGWISRHTVHELIHHLRDIDAGLQAATAAGTSELAVSRPAGSDPPA
ncbi:MAG: DinB family protein [Actinomycetota bacterium]